MVHDRAPAGTAGLCGDVSPLTRVLHARRAGVGAAALALLVLTGCTLSSGEREPEVVYEFAAETIPGESFSAVGAADSLVSPSIHIVSVPEEAQSMTLEFACAGGEYLQAEVGDSMTLEQWPLIGLCDGVQTLSLPITGPWESTMRPQSSTTPRPHHAPSWPTCSTTCTPP